jgi:acyl-[acyl-carrier-protein] desaturase
MAERNVFPDLSQYDDMFLSELRDEIERATDRHNASPRIFVPVEIDDRIEQDIRDGRYNPDDEAIASEVLDALTVNLLTEDGLPYYTSALEHKAPRNHPFLDWIHQWTAEEGRHSPAIFAFLRRSRQVDMRTLEGLRMATMAHPDTPQPDSFIEGIVYPAIQEPATEISHRNSASRLPETHRKAGRAALSPVVGDEVKHGIWYADISEAALRLNSSLTVIAIAKQVLGFGMPGKGIPGFVDRAKAIERADIFGARQLKTIYDELFETRWPLEKLEGLSAEAEHARDLILKKRRQLAALVLRRDELSARAGA